MKPKSHTLFHFTKNQESLKKILEHGFWPKFCLEDVRWYNDEMESIALPIACFCDIPLSRIDEHVDFYGEFGLGLSKNWAIKNGLNPVLYVSNASEVTNSLIDLSWCHEHYPEKDQRQALKQFFKLLAFTKPIEGKMNVSGKFISKEFYQESEWRYLATNDDFDSWLNKEEFEDTELREKQNSLSKNLCSLKIQPADVKYIFVKDDANIPDMINFIQTNLDSFSGADQKILMSRVISLESIKHDL